MKLPEFRSASDLTAASRSTDMSGAFIKPALQDKPMMLQAAKHNLNIRQYSAQDEQKAAVAKYAQTDALLSAGSQVLGILDKIDTGRQQMAAEAAAAEYTMKMANLTADETLNANQTIDPITGTKRWETSSQTYETAKSDLMAEMEKKYKINRKEFQHDLDIKIAAADHSNGKLLRTAQHKGMITQGFVDYQTAFDNTASVVGRKDLTKKAFENTYITAEAYTRRMEDLDHEQIGMMYTGRIQADISGESSRNVLKELETPEKVLAKGLTLEEGKRYRNQAIDRAAFIMADNIRQKVQVTKSRATIDAELANITTADASYFGVTMPEDVNRMRDGLISELEQMKSAMKTSEGKSKVRSQKAYSMAVFDARAGITTEGSTSGQLSMQDLASPNTQDNFSGWMDERFYAPYNDETGQMEGAMDAVEVWGGDGYDRLLAASVKDGAIDKRGAKMLGNNIGNWQDPVMQDKAAKIVNKMMTDPNIPPYMRDEYAKEIGQDNVDFAIALADGTITAEGMADWNAYSLNKGQQENIDLVYTAYTSQSGYDSKQQVRDALGIDEDIPDHIIAPIVADYDRTFKLKHQGQRGGAQMSTYEKQAMIEVANRWTLEKQGVVQGGFTTFWSKDQEYKAVQGSLYNDMNSVDGTPNDAVGMIVGKATTASGNEKILALAEEGLTDIIPTQWGNKEDKLYMLMYTQADSDGNIVTKPMMDATTKLPVFVSGKESFDKIKADQMFEKSVEEGSKLMEQLNQQDKFNSDVNQNRQAVKDFFVKAGKGVKLGSELMDASGGWGATDMIASAGTDYVAQAIRDGVASWFTTDVEDLTPAYLERLLTADNYSNMNLSKEANDHIWKYVTEYREKQMITMNNDALQRGKTAPYSKEQFDVNMANIKNTLTHRGLSDPFND